jgi:2-C-methyl-D-erythritol 4-phosphate cytidylyltransferase
MNSAIIVAAGRGTRMGPQVDKLFLEIAGRPVVAHAWARYDAASCIDEVIVVVRAGMEPAFAGIAASISPAKPYRFVAGGAERQDSVWQGLSALQPDARVVAVHDGARPCPSPALIAATVAAAEATGAAVAAQRVTDTIKESSDGQSITQHLERSRLWAVQTPQAFQVGVLRRALTAVREKGRRVTDDTAACELIGQAVQLIESAEPNPKVTYPSDIPYLELLLAPALPETTQRR